MTANTMIGFRIYLNTPRPAAELVAPFRDVPTGNVCDAMDRLGALDYRIKPLVPDSRLAGPALTVRTRPGDNLMVWKALDVAQPGDVLVIATYAYPTASTFGERVVQAPKPKGWPELSAMACAATPPASAPPECRPSYSARSHPALAKMALVRLAAL